MAHIIIVDDEEELLGLFKLWIERLAPSSTVSTVNDGQKALQVYEDAGADLIIANYLMPLMPGSDLVRTLRARGVTIPIVMTSGYPGAQEKSYDAGATLFVPTTHVVKELPGILSRFLP